MLAQGRLMPAGRHFLTGNSPLSLPPPPTGPPTWPQTGFSPSLKSHPEIGMPVSQLRSLPPPSSLLRSQDHHWVRGDKAAVLYKATAFLRGPGTPLGEAPQIDPVQPKPSPGATPQWALVLSLKTRGHVMQMMPRCFRSIAALTVANRG